MSRPNARRKAIPRNASPAPAIGRRRTTTAQANTNMNPEFTLAIAIPNNKELTERFKPVVIPQGTFPIDGTSDTLHNTAINKISLIAANALGTYFAITDEMRDALRIHTENCYQRNATGNGNFQFLTSKNNGNHTSLTFAAACHQCLRGDDSQARYIWAYPPQRFLDSIRSLVNVAIEDRPADLFFQQALPFLPSDIRGAFMIYQYAKDTDPDSLQVQSFQETLQQDSNKRWYSNISAVIHTAGAPGTRVTTSEPTNPPDSDPSNVPNCVSNDSGTTTHTTDSNPGNNEIDQHVRSISPAANWGHTADGSIQFVHTAPQDQDQGQDVTPTKGNISSNPSDNSDPTLNNDSPPSVAATATVESFPSAINDLSTIPGNANNGSTPPDPNRDASLRGTTQAGNATVVEPTQDNNDDDSTLGAQSRFSARAIVDHFASALRRNSAARRHDQAQGINIMDRMRSMLGKTPDARSPPTTVTFAAPEHLPTAAQLAAQYTQYTAHPFPPPTAADIDAAFATPMVQQAPSHSFPTFQTPSLNFGSTASPTAAVHPSVGNAYGPSAPNTTTTTAPAPVPTPLHPLFGVSTAIPGNTPHPGSSSTGPPLPPHGPIPPNPSMPPTGPPSGPPGPPMTPVGPPGPPVPPPVSGPPVPPPSGTGPVSTSAPLPYIPGIDWREHRIDPANLEGSIVASTYTIKPWYFPRPEVASTINHGVRFKTFVSTRHAYMRAIATPRLGTETMSLKSFLYGFPKLTKSATKADIFDFLSSATRYCMGSGVYVPPPHTMVATSNQGEWYPSLPRHCHDNWEYYDNALYQALTMSSTNLGESDLTKPLLYESSGYQIIWRLAYVADHPRLVENHVDFSMPVQKSSESLLQYRQQWVYYLHMQYLRGVFLSDRYFVESFLRNLHGAYNSTIKPLLLHFVRRIPVDVPVPHYFYPANILSYLASSAANVGAHGITPLQTPKEFAESRRRPQAAPIRSIQQSSPSDDTVVDIRQITDGTVDDDLFLAICSLAAANPRTCDVCGAYDHIVATCPRLRQLLSDPAKAKRLLSIIEQRHSSRGGPISASVPSTTPSPSQSRARTPPTSNRSATIRQLQADDTDEDVASATFTDEEGSVGKPDF